MTKAQMIKRLLNDPCCDYSFDDLKSLSYSEVKKLYDNEYAFDVHVEEGADLFPNGRDFDAEDEDFI